MPGRGEVGWLVEPAQVQGTDAVLAPSQVEALRGAGADLRRRRAVTFQATQRWPPQGWTFGMFFGICFAGLLILRMSPPGWIENWQVGAWGEEFTAKALRALEDDGWVVMHDLDAAGRE